VSDRVLVIDDSLHPRLARELRNRGRRSRHIEDLALRSSLDPQVLRSVFSHFDDPVLITGDDDMPAEHAGVIASVGATIATIRHWTQKESRIGTWEGQQHRTEEEWDQEIVHRWAHVMQLQRTGSIRRYGLAKHGIWKPLPKKRRRQRA